MPNEPKKPELSDEDLDDVSGGHGVVPPPPGLRVGIGDPGIKVVPPGPCLVELPPPCKD